jgi:hypothetical protein
MTASSNCKVALRCRVGTTVQERTRRPASTPKGQRPRSSLGRGSAGGRLWLSLKSRTTTRGLTPLVEQMSLHVVFCGKYDRILACETASQ